MSDFSLPGQYTLLSATLITFSGTQIEFSGFIPTFSIEESIETDSVRGYAEVYDNIGHLEQLPLRGEEDLILEVEDVFGQRTIYAMKIYKITDIEINDANDGLRYTIHMVSRSRFEASFRRVIEPHNDIISNIAQEIFNTYYFGSSQLTVEPTEGIFRCVIPNYTPVQAMNFLASRAYSADSPSCSFRFFEVVRPSSRSSRTEASESSYYFVSDEYLINQAFESGNILDFSYSDALNKSGEEFEQQMRNLVNIRNTERVNTMRDLAAGAYRSQVTEIDLVRGRVTLSGMTDEYSYNFNEERSGYTFTSGPNLPSTDQRHTPGFTSTYFTQENEKRYIVVRDYADDAGQFQIRGDQHLPEIVTNRTAYRHHMSATTVTATANGRLDLNAGDVINFSIPQFDSSSTIQQNRQLAGFYLVSSVTQNFVRDVHTTNLKLMKYDWSEPV